MHMTTITMFWMIISSTSGLGSDMIVLDNVLKIWIELIKSGNDNVMEKSYRLRTFQKLIILVEISKISKIFGKMTISSREALLLYELSEREPG